MGGVEDLDAVEADDKIVAVLHDDVAFGHIRDIREIPQGLIDRLRHYFLTYKQLPQEAPRRVDITDVYGPDEALDVIQRSFDDYRTHFGAPESRLAELRRLLAAAS